MDSNGGWFTKEQSERRAKKIGDNAEKYFRIARVVDALTPPIYRVVDNLQENGDMCAITYSEPSRYQNDVSDDFYFSIPININGTNPCQATPKFHFQVKNLEKTVMMIYGIDKLIFIKSEDHTTFFGNSKKFEFALESLDADNLRENDSPMKWQEHACLITKKAIFMTSLEEKCKNYAGDVKIESVLDLTKQEFVIGVKYIGATVMEYCKDGLCKLFGYEPPPFKTKTRLEEMTQWDKPAPNENSYTQMELIVSFTSEPDSFVRVIDPGPPQDFQSVKDFVAFMRKQMGRKPLGSMLFDLNQRLDVYLDA